jgi:hypothetical protein
MANEFENRVYNWLNDPQIQGIFQNFYVKKLAYNEAREAVVEKLLSLFRNLKMYEKKKKSAFKLLRLALSSTEQNFLINTDGQRNLKKRDIDKRRAILAKVRIIYKDLIPDLFPSEFIDRAEAAAAAAAAAAQVLLFAQVHYCLT